jgi:pimeloyl-ACP methyl ester carboxylesterase
MSTPVQLFQAPWPTGHTPRISPRARQIFFIALGIICAAYSTQLALCYAGYWALRRVACWIIHPKASPFAGRVTDRSFQQYENVSFLSSDGTKITGYFYEVKGSERAIVLFTGNGASSGDVIQFLYPNILNTLPQNTSLLLVDPRGVDLSEGSSDPSMLQYDAFAALAYLRAQGINKFCVFGWSLGASYGTIGSQIFEDTYKARVHVIADRTFSRLSRVIPIFGPLIKIFGLEMDTGHAASRLQGQMAAVFHPADGVISLSASLANDTRVVAERPNLLTEALDEDLKSPSTIAHCLPLDESFLKKLFQNAFTL